MARVKKPKPVTLPATAMVDNPEWRPERHGMKAFPKRIEVAVNVRESAVATLASKGMLGSAQVAAADRFRSLWEAMGGKGARAIDYSRTPVDGGSAVEPIRMSQLDAGRQLKRCRELLGEYGYNLVRLIAGERRSLHEICGSRRERDSTADHLKRDLTALAQMWGYETRR